MLTVDDALREILKRVPVHAPEAVTLQDAWGLVLAEEIVSPVDSPPFDKSLMDGYAVRAADCTASGVELKVVDEVTAGRVSSRSLESGEAIRIMTGAPLPAGCDAVVPVERTRFDDATQTVTIQAEGISSEAHILRRGAAMREGDRILSPGRRLQPQEMGALAELGCASVQVRRRPRVAILATGDELVPFSETPGAGQIRNSNEVMLTAQVLRAGGVPVPLGIARDERSDLRAKIESGLECDFLLLSGGVSAGKLDLVPSELEAAGVREVFHKVNVKPGKPLWFGLRSPDGAEASGSTFVFGLPGNPVSSLVCFELFARTAIRHWCGTEPATPTAFPARLSQAHIARGDRPTYHPARLEFAADGPVVIPVPWQGSADLRGTVDANCMAVFPPGDATYDAGAAIKVIPWD